MVKVLELFSGTHSIGKVCKTLGYEVVSVDRDLGGKCPFEGLYESDIHIKVDIMSWDYKTFSVGEFDIITASPVCLWWSRLRNSWIGRKLKGSDTPVTRESLQKDIDTYGKPMVDKVFEIIDYFKPKYWWIENPQTGKMKDYITEVPFFDVDYCKYGFPYKKRTRFWTNIEGFEPKLCKWDCDFVVKIGKRKSHKVNLSSAQRGDNGELINTKEKRKEYKAKKKHICSAVTKGGGSNRLERYRIPEGLIVDLLAKCEF